MIDAPYLGLNSGRDGPKPARSGRRRTDDDLGRDEPASRSGIGTDEDGQIGTIPTGGGERHLVGDTGGDRSGPDRRPGDQQDRSWDK